MKKLQDIATIRTGVYVQPMPAANAFYLQLSDFDEAGKLRPETACTAYIGDKAAQHLLRAGDLLLAAKGANNICIVVPPIGYPSVASPSFLVIRIHDKSRLLPEYAAWYLNLPSTRQQLSEKVAKGTAIRSIAKTELGNMEIPMPPLEQQYICIELARLQHREQQLYRAIAERRKRLLDYEITKRLK